MKTVENVIHRDTNALEDRTEMGNDPVDPLCDPAVQWDQRFMERIENIKMLLLFRCDAQPVVGLCGGMMRGIRRAGGGITAATPGIAAAIGRRWRCRRLPRRTA